MYALLMKMKKGMCQRLTLIAMLLSPEFSYADSQQSCLLQALQQAKPSDTAAIIRGRCTQKNQHMSEVVVERQGGEPSSAPEILLASIDNGDRNAFSITPYNRNYILPVTYNNNPNAVPYQRSSPGTDVDHVEVKFQVSFQARLAEGLFNKHIDLWGAYTQQSWWQLYNSDQSSPFRETNYEPELFFRWQQDNELLGFSNRIISFGFNHQSNGRGGSLSRSWNRLFATAEFDRGNLAVITRAWWRLPESEKYDDNPDIIKYLGYGDIKTAYKWDEQVFSMTLRNNLRSDNKGAVQLDWTFPLSRRFKGYIQYFNGYGESLIDYTESTSRIGIGILLTDWL